MNFLQKNSIEVMNWPAHCPDLNPIENVCIFLNRTLFVRSIYPSNASELFANLCNICNAVPDAYFKSLMESMAQSFSMLIKKRGGSTKY